MFLLSSNSGNFKGKLHAKTRQLFVKTDSRKSPNSLQAHTLWAVFSEKTTAANFTTLGKLCKPLTDRALASIVSPD